MRMPGTGGQRRGMFCYTKTLISLLGISTLHWYARVSDILWLDVRDLDTWDPIVEFGPWQDPMALQDH